MERLTFEGNDTDELDQAINHLKKEYERAKGLAYVNNPLAWALYQTWKYFDRKRGKEL